MLIEQNKEIETPEFPELALLVLSIDILGTLILWGLAIFSHQGVTVNECGNGWSNFVHL